MGRILAPGRETVIFSKDGSGVSIPQSTLLFRRTGCYISICKSIVFKGIIGSLQNCGPKVNVAVERRCVVHRCSLRLAVAHLPILQNLHVVF